MAEKEKKEEVVNEAGYKCIKDEWGRTTFYEDSRGFWCFKYYEEPVEGGPVNVTPLKVFHKYSYLYTMERFK